jgi:SprT-like family protein
MSETASIRPAIAELERAFTALTVLFKREIPLPIITIQTKGRRAASGWFWHQKWQNGKPEGLSEINICAEHLSRPPLDIAEILLHEMCHYANALDGIDDCSANQYHRKSFRVRCDAVGLICQSGPRGWASTSLTPELAERVRALGIDPEAFSLFRKGKQQAKVGSRMKKWRCGCTTIRAAVEVDATCGKCG